MTELSLVENQRTRKKVRFSDDYCNHTGDRGYAAFHEELDPDVIRSKFLVHSGYCQLITKYLISDNYDEIFIV